MLLLNQMLTSTEKQTTLQATETCVDELYMLIAEEKVPEVVMFPSYSTRTVAKTDLQERLPTIQQNPPRPCPICEGYHWLLDCPQSCKAPGDKYLTLNCPATN
ncbi:zinc finger CCHC domain-containing protein 23-like [Ictidomys tridecemlineatus]|nr:zinc finger CCHC domain-containing protein 23-like [Ictidomys tridecemlineatus]